jgi:hypothetical protein
MWKEAVVAKFKVHLLGDPDEKQENPHSANLVTWPSFKLRPPDHKQKLQRFGHHNQPQSLYWCSLQALQ